MGALVKRYWSTLDDWVAFVVDLDEDDKKIRPDRQPNTANSLGKVVTQLWIEEIWNRRGDSVEYLEELEGWVQIRTGEQIVGNVAEMAFKKMVTEDAAVKFRALPRYQMAVLLGEF